MNSMDLLKALNDIDDKFLAEKHELKLLKNNKNRSKYKKRICKIKVLKPCMVSLIFICVIVFSVRIERISIFNEKNNNKEESLIDEICINEYLLNNKYKDFNRYME